MKFFTALWHWTFLIVTGILLTQTDFPVVVEGSVYVILRASDKPVIIFIKHNLFLCMNCCELTILYILIRPNDDLLKANTCSCWYYVKLYIFFMATCICLFYTNAKGWAKSPFGGGEICWDGLLGLNREVLRRLGWRACCGQLPYLTHQAELTLVSLPFHSIRRSACYYYWY
jgi:hypothetical protein